MKKLYFVVSEVYNPNVRHNAYSFSSNINKDLYLDSDKTFAKSESIVYEPEPNKKGGMIIFSTVVNAEQLSDNKLVNWLKQKYKTVQNNVLKNQKIDNIANKHNLVGWTVGKFLHGRYTAKNGKVFDENSLSVEIIGVDFTELVAIAQELCVEFLQESVLVKDYSSNRIVFVDAA